MAKVYSTADIAAAVQDEFDTEELHARALLLKARADRWAWILADPDADGVDRLLDLEERLNERGGYRAD